MAKSSKARSGKRREELRRNLPKPTFSVRELLDRPDVINFTLILVGFVSLASMVVVWSRDQVKVRDGQVMTDTRIRRLDYAEPDTHATDLQRDEARESAPQVWELNHSYLDRLAASLNGLPLAVAGKDTIDLIEDTVRDEFGLDAATLAALEPFAIDGATTDAWISSVRTLVEVELPAKPLLSSQDYQSAWASREYSTTLRRQLRRADGTLEDLEVDAIERRPDATADLERSLRSLVARAGFPQSVAPCIIARILRDDEPVMRFDADASSIEAERAAEQVRTAFIEHRRGEIIYLAGDVLSPQKYQEVLIENERFAEQAPFGQRWMPRFGVIGLLAVVGLFIGVFVMTSYPRITRNPLRAAALLALMVGMLAVTTLITVQAPTFLLPAAVAPTLFVAVLLLLAYDARLAVFLGGLQCALAALALEHGIGLFLVLVAGSVTMIALLREVRNRSSLTRAAAWTSVVIGAAALVLGLLETPMIMDPLRPAIKQIFGGALYAVLSTLFVGFLVLGILPSVERIFDITTGMTLAELRDPKQPLLRQLQQKAPGTYNHSLQVGNIAEAAAEAIGADGLLVYVGAMYHDIGKMNKPEYFVENQTGGNNKHENLSPAMSLLIIVGHVKDGIELAREYNLPRRLQHFIESHHGTTLVEYFFHAARTQAEGDDKASVNEVEFRYPGPKPRTKEAAILMLSDAVESATRAMSEPNPSRIESLVRELSRKRLLDGQFDQSDLSLHELNAIEDAMISRLCAVHHGRISYPTSREDEAGDDEAALAG